MDVSVCGRRGGAWWVSSEVGRVGVGRVVLEGVGVGDSL